MLQTAKFFILLLTFCFFSSFASACPTYKLVDLKLPKNDFSNALSVNDHGQVLGVYVINNKYHFFIWEKKKGIKLLDLPNRIQPKILNNIGQVAGNVLVEGDTERARARGFVWDPTRGYTEFETARADGQINVSDMNDHGQIVGGNRYRAFLWESGVLRDLGSLTDDTSDGTIAFSINNLGQIVGASGPMAIIKGGPARRAIIWNNGIIEEIDPSFQGHAPLFSSINDDGLVAWYKDGSPEESGYYVMDTKSKKILAKVSPCTKKNPKTIYLSGIKINNRGDLLVLPFKICFKNSVVDKKSGATSVTYDSLDILTAFPKIAPKKKWKKFEVANDFNNKNWIVGYATKVDGKNEAVLLVPVKPRNKG